MTHKVGDIVTIMGKEYEVVSMPIDMTPCTGCAFSENPLCRNPESCSTGFLSIYKRVDNPLSEKINEAIETLEELKKLLKTPHKSGVHYKNILK
jgi:hypothetical protein